MSAGTILTGFAIVIILAAYLIQPFRQTGERDRDQEIERWVERIKTALPAPTLEDVCPQCGEPIQSTHRFCPSCGTELSGEGKP